MSCGHLPFCPIHQASSEFIKHPGNALTLDKGYFSGKGIGIVFPQDSEHHTGFLRGDSLPAVRLVNLSG
jgi:hypothetical protein